MSTGFNPFTAAKPTKYSVQTLPSERGGRYDIMLRPHWDPTRELPSPPFVPEEDLSAARALPQLGSSCFQEDDDRLTETHPPLDLLHK